MCCWGWQNVAGEKETGGRDKGKNMERKTEKQGGRGSKSSETRQIQRRNPPSRQMNIVASLPPPSPPPPISIAVFFPSSLPCFLSIIHQCTESPQLTAPAAAAALAAPPSPLDLLVWLLQPNFQHSRPPLRLQAWILRAGPFLQLRGRVSHHKTALFAAEKRKTRGEKSGFFWWNPVCLPRFFPFGLQFWLYIGTRQRGPKCLKLITCCRCLGVTLRCVALTYVACWDTTLISSYLSVLCICGISVLFERNVNNISYI